MRRRPSAVGREPKMDRVQTRRCERSSFDDLDQLTEQPEVGGGRFHSAGDLVHPPAGTQHDADLHDQPGEQGLLRKGAGEAAASSATVAAAARREPGERAERRAGRLQARPAVQRARAADVRLGGEHGERLAEIDVRPPAPRPPDAAPGSRRSPRAIRSMRQASLRRLPCARCRAAGTGRRARRDRDPARRDGCREIVRRPVRVPPTSRRCAPARARRDVARGVPRSMRSSTRAWTTTSTTNADPAARSQAGDTQLAAEGQPRDERRGAGGREPQVGDAEVRAFAVADDAVPALDSPLVLLTRGHRRRHRHRQIKSGSRADGARARRSRPRPPRARRSR